MVCHSKSASLVTPLFTGLCTELAVERAINLSNVSVGKEGKRPHTVVPSLVPSLCQSLPSRATDLPPSPPPAPHLILAADPLLCPLRDLQEGRAEGKLK